MIPRKEKNLQLIFALLILSLIMLTVGRATKEPRIDSDPAAVLRSVGTPFGEVVMNNLLAAFTLADPSINNWANMYKVAQEEKIICYFTEECKYASSPNGFDWGMVLSKLEDRMYDNFPDMFLFPALAGAVVPVYNLPGIENLKLPVNTLGEIFRACEHGEPECVNGPTRGITRWNDSRILANNHHLNASMIDMLGKIGRIQPFAYGLRDETTLTWKGALAASNTEFRDQMGNYTYSSEPIWPGATMKFFMSSAGAAGRLSLTVGTIAYLVWDESLEAYLQIARLAPTLFFEKGLPVGQQSTSIAIQERGLNLLERSSNSRYVCYLDVTARKALND